VKRLLLRLTIAPRITLLIVLGVGLILGVVSLSDYHQVRSMLEDELRGRAQNLATATARQMEVVKRAVEKVVQELGVVLESEALGSNEIFPLLEATLLQHGEVYGSAVLLHPRSATAARAVSIPYVYRQGGSLLRKDLSSPDYHYEIYDWYVLPRELQTPVWTEPYYDEGGGESLMVTYSVPVFSRTPREFVGLVTGDVSLGWLEAMVGSMELGRNGYAFLLSRNGSFISHPRRELVMCESIFSVAEERNDPDLRVVGQSMVRGGSGFVAFHSLLTGEASWAAYAPVPGTGWSLAAVFPQQEIMAQLYALSRMKLALGGVGLVLLFGVALWIALSITRPIRALQGAAQTLAGGDLDAVLPPAEGNDEVARLSRSFAVMQRDLKQHIAELQDATAARTRIETDLQIARDIQMGLVPKRFTFEPPRPELDLHALLEPAREVGGDFYDFYWQGPDELFVAVGDVSGKGVPAALFMALAKAYLKAFVTQGLDPAAALTRLDDALSADNDAGMFLTVFCGLMNLRTGECRHASAGHNPPFVLRRAGTVEVLAKTKGGVLGTGTRGEFAAASLQLHEGDTLFACTDGVAEAEDAAAAFYGEERAIAHLASLAGRSAADIVHAVRNDVRAFAGAAPQSDDITLLALRFLGRSV
jgi:sigma-B regulation protein RsbU (phosphoserine phosphatase)